jgi:hypothetical protein
MSQGRRALAFTLASFVLWSGLYLWKIAGLHPWADLSRGKYSDHFSHMNATRVFPRVGIDIWRVPMAQAFPRISAEEAAALPRDVSGMIRETFDVPGWPRDKPMVQGWSFIPRLYPPGDMLLVAPIAAAYHHTGLTFAAANRLLVLLFLAGAHVTLFVMLRSALAPSPQPGSRVLFLAVAYTSLVYWALEGFYDVWALAPLVIAAALLARGRGLAALVAYSVAAVLHFRAFMLGPWAIYAAYLALRQRPWGRRGWAAIAVIAVLSVASLAPFALVWPTINALPPQGGIDSSPKLVALVLMTAACGAAFAFARAWLDLSVLCWVAVMLYGMRGVYPWYWLFLLPWLVAPVVGRAAARASWVGDARFAAVSAFTMVTMNYPIVPGWPLLVKLPW